jgi:hypothetical protein
MYVEVELSFLANPNSVSGRTAFWTSFEAKRTGGVVSSDLSLSVIDNHERQFKQKFPRTLERLVNDEIESALGSRTASESTETTDKVGTTEKAASPKIKMRLVTVQYGCIKPTLDIVGVSNADLRDFILMSLSIYAPQAFNRSMGTNLDMQASTTLLGDMPEIRSPTPSSTLSDRSSEVVSRAWMIANGSLVVPVLLALAVFYFAFKESSLQATDLKTERTEIVKALAEQNKAISVSTVEQAKQASANAKALQDALIKILTEKKP